MVAAAKRRAGVLALENVEFRVVDASAIDLPAGAVDAVICRFGIMLVPDPSRALAEIARVLKPGGRVAIAVWAEGARNDWMTAAGRSALELGLSERPDPRDPGPFRLADEAELRELVGASGLEVEVLEEVVVRWHASSFDEWWDVVSDMSRMLATLVETLDAEQLAALREGAERRLTAYRAEDGSVDAPGVARALLARRP